MTYYWNNRSELKNSLNHFYSSIGISKQSFHQFLARSNRFKEEVHLLIELILQIRKNHPVIGIRSLYYKINPVFIGRDRFEELCKSLGLKTYKTKNYRRTTDSSGVIRFDNLLEGFTLTWIDEIWSSDITYFEIDRAFFYITFIIDNYSRRILGHQVSSRLSTEHTTLPALKMAIKNRGGNIVPGIIFHSDGGGQYYDAGFLALTTEYNFRNSMCEYPWENGKAERVNGTIKNEYLIHWGINSLKSLIRNVDRAVKLYNTDRNHLGLGRRTPVEFENNLLSLNNKKK